MRAPRWITAVSVFRVVVGTGLVLAPGSWSRPWIGPGVDTPIAKLMARMFGAGELLLGVGVLMSMQDARRAARWMHLGSVADAVDGVAALAAWQHLPRTARYADAAMAFGAALANQAAAHHLLHHAGPDGPEPPS